VLERRTGRASPSSAAKEQGAAEHAPTTEKEQGAWRSSRRRDDAAAGVLTGHLGVAPRAP
jgi:hypothetical protein